MNNLSASKWAPRNWRGQPSSSGLGPGLLLAAGPSPDIELDKHKKLLARLKWKSHLLVLSHQRVTQALQEAGQGTNHSLSATEAETMFKLDFFEYYVLLERVLLHLLAVFDISVSAHVVQEPAGERANGSKNAATQTNGAPIIGSSNYDRSYTHRFHANVLQALDRPSSPLHATLGMGDVRYYLGIAKESRNRWKDAEEEQAQGDVIPDHNALKHQRMLKNVDLEVMLGCILEALHKAQGIAEEHVKTRGQRTDGSAEAGVPREYDMEDTPLEVMPDAMEWEEL
jgi:hypothetical protein